MHRLEDIRRFLRSDFGWDAIDLEEVGSGAWSTAYRFDADGRDLVIRVGAHVEDFEADQAVARYRSAQLPIPRVLHVGPFGEEHCCISTYAPGAPIELCSATEWELLVPSLVDAVEAMRQCRPSHRIRPWNEVLLAVDSDHSGTRLDGWREKISRSLEAVAALGASMSQLRRLHEDIDLGAVEPTLTHGDPINRNAHVAGGVLSGIFDWGCLRWGDHLYDLAWFEFWSPWYPELDVGLLGDALDRRWFEGGHEVPNRAGRERACLLHIGADHLIYHAVIDSPSGLEDLLERMGDLDLI